jgi:hypothetical protein
MAEADETFVSVQSLSDPALAELSVVAQVHDWPEVEAMAERFRDANARDSL